MLLLIRIASTIDWRQNRAVCSGSSSMSVWQCSQTPVAIPRSPIVNSRVPDSPDSCLLWYLMVVFISRNLFRLIPSKEKPCQRRWPYPMLWTCLRRSWKSHDLSTFLPCRDTPAMRVSSGESGALPRIQPPLNSIGTHYILPDMCRNRPSYKDCWELAILPRKWRATSPRNIPRNSYWLVPFCSKQKHDSTFDV